MPSISMVLFYCHYTGAFIFSDPFAMSEYTSLLPHTFINPRNKTTDQLHQYTPLTDHLGTNMPFEITFYWRNENYVIIFAIHAQTKHGNPWAAKISKGMLFIKIWELEWHCICPRYKTSMQLFVRMQRPKYLTSFMLKTS
jgi:hypothetical protein